MDDVKWIHPSTGVLGVVTILVLFIAATINVQSCVWAHDRFSVASGNAVQIRTDDKAEPLYLCADVVNTRLQNCLSAKEVAEAGRAKYRK